jgi:hypothetical protein
MREMIGSTDNTFLASSVIILYSGIVQIMRRGFRVLRRKQPASYMKYEFSKGAEMDGKDPDIEVILPNPCRYSSFDPRPPV